MARRRAVNQTRRSSKPDNALLWRMNKRRLEAEAVRDALLFVDGRRRPGDDPAARQGSAKIPAKEFTIECGEWKLGVSVSKVIPC